MTRIKLPLLLCIIPELIFCEEECVKKTRQEMLGAPASCNLATTEGCDGHEATITYSSGSSFVICEVSHMCILVQEEFMFNAWGVTEEKQLEDATFLDETCNGFDVDGAIVGKPGVHHWLFCVQKACDSEKTEDNTYFDCGTTTTTNSTHISFENKISFEPAEVEETGPISFGSSASTRVVPVICAWQTGFFQTSSLTWTDNAATIILLHDQNTQTSKFTVEMMLYSESSFSDASRYSAISPPLLNLNENLNILVDITDLSLSNSGVRPKAGYLWASLSADPLDFSNVQFLVWDECEQHLDSVIHANGNENTVRVTTPNVAWAKDLFGGNCDYTEQNCPTYLHAFVTVCSPFRAESGCSKKTCDEIAVLNDTIVGDFNDEIRRIAVNSKKRRRRQIENRPDNIVSLGPFSVGKGRADMSYIDKDDETYNRILAFEKKMLNENYQENEQLDSATRRAYIIGIVLIALSVVFVLAVVLVLCFSKRAGSNQ